MSQAVLEKSSVESNLEFWIIIWRGVKFMTMIVTTTTMMKKKKISARSMKDKKCMQTWVGKPAEKKQMEGLNVDSKTVL
jgi:hypothetical protein